jgi:hypothetical protein
MKKEIIQKLKSLKGQVNNPDLFVLSDEINKEIDNIFYFNYKKSESSIESSETDIYTNIDSKALLTNYFDYYQILDDVERDTIVDLGAGYCKGTLLSQYIEHSCKCISIEVEPVRVKVAKELAIDPLDIIYGDLLDKSYTLPLANAYFIYLPAGALLTSIINKIIIQQIKAIFYVIESHGDLIDMLKFYPEIFEELDSKLTVSQRRHDSKIYKFQSKVFKANKINKKDLSNKNIHLWLLTYGEEDTFIIVESKVSNSNTTRQWKANLKSARLMRYNGELSIQIFSPFRILQLETQDKIVRITQE